MIRTLAVDQKSLVFGAMTSSSFICVLQGSVDRIQCKVCFSNSRERSKTFVTRAICASVHGRPVSSTPVNEQYEPSHGSTRG